MVRISFQKSVNQFKRPFCIPLPQELPALQKILIICYTTALSGFQIFNLSENAFLLFRLIVQRSEEHTSELQSRGHLVCRPPLEKKKKRNRSLNTTLAP